MTNHIARPLLARLVPALALARLWRVRLPLATSRALRTLKKNKKMFVRTRFEHAFDVKHVILM